MKFPFRSVHIIGVCGTLMGSFAAFLRRNGVEVTGSDENVYPPMSDVLTQAGVRVLSPYSAERFREIQPELIVVGNVIRGDNVEACAAKSSGIPRVSLPEFMEKHLLPGTRNLVVAGTHGKTTTSSILAATLSRLNAAPSYFIGGVSQDLPHSFEVRESSPYFVLEGDEYDTVYWDKVPKFFHYLPDEVILTSVEFDHADIYADLGAVVRAFEGLMDRIRPHGHILICVSSATQAETMQQLSKRAAARGVLVSSYGLAGSGADWSIKATDYAGLKYEILESGRVLGQIELQIAGEHNALNALAVLAQLHRLGFKFEAIKEALSQFVGVKRRQEVRGDVGGITVVDDFAHHPTAVRETLKALRQKYPGRILHAVFEPRSATSRRKVFQAEYAQAFRTADRVWIAKPYDQSRIQAEDRFSTEDLIQDLVGHGTFARSFDAPQAGVLEVIRQAKPGDVVAVLSNGGFGGFISLLLEGLKARAA